MPTGKKMNKPREEKNAKPNYDAMYLKVFPKRAGNFGYASISGIHYEDDRHITDMQEQIERHIDNIQSIEIDFDEYWGKKWVCRKCESDYETEKEAEICCASKNEEPK